MRLYAFHECPTSNELYTALAFLADRVTRNELNWRLDALFESKKNDPETFKAWVDECFSNAKIDERELEAEYGFEEEEEEGEEDFLDNSFSDEDECDDIFECFYNGEGF